jgi:cyclophilin family peptidyl-prolyl cis-trans isomerase
MFRDDPKKQSNDRGYVAFTKTGPNMRWAPLMIHAIANRQLDQVGHSPVGRVIQGMEVIDALAKEPTDESLNAVQLQQVGDAYLKAKFPKIQYVTSATLL